MHRCHSKTGNCVKFMRKVKRKNWRRSIVLLSTKSITMRRLVEDQDIIFEVVLVKCRKIIEMLNQYAVDIPTLPVTLCHSHSIQFLLECQAVLLERRAAEKGRQAFGTKHGISGNVFVNPHQHFILKNCINGIHRSRNRFIHTQWSRVEDLGKRSVYTHFRKDRNFEICQMTKTTRASCRRRNGGVVRRAEKFGDLITAYQKSKNCAKQKLHRKFKEGCKSSWSPTGILESFTLTIPWEFGKVCEDFSWNHCTSTPHRQKQMGLLRKAVLLYCCNRV